MSEDALIRDLYAAFNRRDVEAALAQMTEDVSWPKASEGGRVVGKEAIRDYWSRQWAEFNPRVELVEMVPLADGTVRVAVHQVVRRLAGELLFDGEVEHRYTLRNGLVARMDLAEEPGAFGR